MKKKANKGFRGSLGGFRKADVNAYIIELSRKYTEMEDSYREKISELEAKVSSLAASLAAADARADDAEKKAAERAESPAAKDAGLAQEALAEIKKMRSGLKKKIKELETKYGDILPPSKKEKKEEKPASPLPEDAAEKKAPRETEEKSGCSDEFDDYLKQFRSATATLFDEFDKKYGTNVSGARKNG